jgi:hypothetical protein
MKLRKCYTLLIILMLTGSLMAQTSETSDKATEAKQQSQVTAPKKETKSQSGTTTGKTGTYQKATKQTNAASAGKTGRKPRTKKERLEMEAAAKAGALQNAGGQQGSFQPGPDGFIEISHADAESFIARIGMGKVKIKSFSLLFTKNGKQETIENASSSVTGEVKEAVKGFTAGQTFFIENARGVTREGREVTLPTQKFRMKDSAEQSPSKAAR